MRIAVLAGGSRSAAPRAEDAAGVVPGHVERMEHTSETLTDPVPSS